MKTLDTETCGLSGPVVTIQWAQDEGEPRIHEVWRSPIRDTLRLIESFCAGPVQMWNGTFDWFHLQRAHNILRLLPAGKQPSVRGWLAAEQEAVGGPCLKPEAPLDLFLYARRGPWQSLMNRDDIRIRRVPRVLAEMLCDHLGSQIELDPIYFSRRKKGMVWELPTEGPGSIKEDPEFPDVVLRFGASGGLKPLSRHLLGVEAIDMPFPPERQFKGPEWNLFDHSWVDDFQFHLDYWHTNEGARKYAKDDVVLTRALGHHFGDPVPGDVDSVLACLVGSSRWRGFAVDAAKLGNLAAECERRMAAVPERDNPAEVLKGLHGLVTPVEALAIKNTRSETLDAVQDQFKGEPVAEYAARVQGARSAKKHRDLCQKLMLGGFHPDAKIIGTLSGRMAGTGGLNMHGLPTEIKECLPLSWGQLARLAGGDFDSFEVTIAAAVYGDAALTADLADGRKMHAIFGSNILGLEYEDIYDDEAGKAVDPEVYLNSKRAFLGRMYGAQDPKLASVFGVPVEQVAAGTAALEERYPGIGAARQRTADKFQSMKQPGGIGTAVVWSDPAEYVESLFGFRRYFTLENKIEKALFELAGSLPKSFHAIRDLKIMRKAGRVQTPGGAVQSAIYAAAFNLQARAMRAAANHEIQSSGAHITKRVQVAIWDRQPAGVNPWVVQPMQEHDSIFVPHHPAATEFVRDSVVETVEWFRKQVPLLKIKWKDGLTSWK